MGQTEKAVSSGRMREALSSKPRGELIAEGRDLERPVVPDGALEHPFFQTVFHVALRH